VWKALLASGEPSVLGYLVYHYRQKQGTPSYRQDISSLCSYKRTALNAYKVWNPTQGRYAVGYHSVKDLFDLAASDCGEYVVRPPSTTPPPPPPPPPPSGTQTRQVPIASIPTSGSCTTSCVTALNSDDGRYMRWLACTNGTLTSTEYANPTTFVFSVPEAARVTAASLAIDARGAGTNAAHEITCLNAAGQVLATPVASFKFSTTAKVNTFNVPVACFAETNVRIRLRRTGSNCIEADFARLSITYQP
jgi:hypothetical protein